MEKCEICGKEVKAKQQLKMHMATHKNVSESSNAKPNEKVEKEATEDDGLMFG